MKPLSETEGEGRWKAWAQKMGFIPSFARRLSLSLNPFVSPSIKMKTTYLNKEWIYQCHRLPWDLCIESSTQNFILFHFISVPSRDPSHIKKLRSSYNFFLLLLHTALKSTYGDFNYLQVRKTFLLLFHHFFQQKHYCSQIHYASLNANNRGRLGSLWLKRTLLLGKLGYSNLLNLAQCNTGCSGSIWEQKD